MSRNASVRVDKLEDLAGDLAGKYRSTANERVAAVDPDLVDADLAALNRDGYLILERLISAEACSEITAAIDPLLGSCGRNSFEGQRTQRVYNLLTKTRTCDVIAEHPRVLAILDRLLLPNYLLSQLQAINIEPGEAAQLLHFDDAMYPIPRPRPALSVTTIWAINDFTADNGATVVLPRSNSWGGGRRPTDDDERLSVAMPAGSVVVFLGTTWHSGGANSSEDRRLGITSQYCEPWLRQIEALALSTPPDTVRTVSENIRRMLGYSVYPPFVGMVDGMHPKRILETTE
ncbi:phytanoyl-CoA dioxygenase family protein [Aldersonia kunmingensis]|uniref:phytanoyl-CoA dioxygenase family protein n=1 Tax=Aldersonia kunmingensis TaxID=408066 RepID=UPI000831B169|nr:phytanoyl-CoA dioxygenase family protein [Aldersonia kunmingensis]